MQTRTPALVCAVLLTALVGIRCGGDVPATPVSASATAVSEHDAGVASSAVRLTKQRWIVQDLCDDRRGIRVRLHDFTDRATQYPRGYWRIVSEGTINRVIECQTGHQICLGAVQDPPPGLVWGVGIRGDRFPCRAPGKCCFRCDTFAHFLKLSCEARTTNGALELDAAISDELELELE